MALPKEPRQKMINVMYLVLTALLALNVSSEVLNAFRTMDKSFSNASAVIDNKTNTIFSSFESKLKDPKTSELASIWKPKADKAKQLSDELVAYIEDLKTKIKNEAGSSGDHFNEKNTNAPTKIMVDEPNGKELLKRLTEYKNNILSIDPKIEAQFKNSFPLDLSMPPVQNKSNNTWEAAYFRRTPALAAITILSKFQSDIKNAEAQVVEYCHNQIGEVQVVYDEFQALATANSQVLYPGSEFTITAGVGAFSKNAKPSVTIDGVQVPLNENGLAEYKTVAGNPGSYTKKVNVSFVKPDGTTATLTKDIQYVVAAPTGLTVSADAVKVLYVGLDNPISISGGSGTNASNLKVSISQGTITGSNGRYIAHVTTPGTATITVNDGKKTTSFDFRVKTVPTPTAMVGNSRGGRMRVNDFKAQSGVRAELENFVFEGVKFTVTSYTITFAGAGYPEFMYKAVSGNSFAPARSLIERAQPGSTITIDEIRAVGPGGPRTLAPIAFNLY